MEPTENLLNQQPKQSDDIDYMQLPKPYFAQERPYTKRAGKPGHGHGESSYPHPSVDIARPRISNEAEALGLPQKVPLFRNIPGEVIDFQRVTSKPKHFASKEKEKEQLLTSEWHQQQQQQEQQQQNVNTPLDMTEEPVKLLGIKQMNIDIPVSFSDLPVKGEGPSYARTQVQQQPFDVEQLEIIRQEYRNYIENLYRKLWGVELQTGDLLINTENTFEKHNPDEKQTEQQSGKTKVQLTSAANVESEDYSSIHTAEAQQKTPTAHPEIIENEDVIKIMEGSTSLKKSLSSLGSINKWSEQNFDPENPHWGLFGYESSETLPDFYTWLAANITSHSSDRQSSKSFHSTLGLSSDKIPEHKLSDLSENLSSLTFDGIKRDIETLHETMRAVKHLSTTYSGDSTTSQSFNTTSIKSSSDQYKPQHYDKSTYINKRPDNEPPVVLQKPVSQNASDASGHFRTLFSTSESLESAIDQNVGEGFDGVRKSSKELEEVPNVTMHPVMSESDTSSGFKTGASYTTQPGRTGQLFEERQSHYQEFQKRLPGLPSSPHNVYKTRKEVSSSILPGNVSESQSFNTETSVSTGNMTSQSLAEKDLNSKSASDTLSAELLMDKANSLLSGLIMSREVDSQDLEQTFFSTGDKYNSSQRSGQTNLSEGSGSVLYRVSNLSKTGPKVTFASEDDIVHASGEFKLMQECDTSSSSSECEDGESEPSDLTASSAEQTAVGEVPTSYKPSVTSKRKQQSPFSPYDKLMSHSLASSEGTPVNASGTTASEHTLLSTSESAAETDLLDASNYKNRIDVNRIGEDEVYSPIKPVRLCI